MYQEMYCGDAFIVHSKTWWEIEQEVTLCPICRSPLIEQASWLRQSSCLTAFCKYSIRIWATIMTWLKIFVEFLSPFNQMFIHLNFFFTLGVRILLRVWDQGCGISSRSLVQSATQHWALCVRWWANNTTDNAVTFHTMNKNADLDVSVLA
jgi:hypothetical protein